MRTRMMMLGTLLVAALPLGAGVIANDPRGVARLDATPASATRPASARPAPDAGDSRVLYFVITKGADPDFVGMGGTLENRWKNRRLVRIPPQAVAGLARHPDVLYLQRVEPPGGGAQQFLESSAERASGVPVDDGKLLSAVAELGAHTWTSGDYAYDGAGNIISIGPDHYNRTQRYDYDRVGRLAHATAHTQNALHSESYAYDAFGNMTKTTDGVTDTQHPPSSTTNRMSGPGDAYDGAGNLTSDGMNEYFRDGGGMLKEMWYGAAGQVGYIYTPDDERLATVYAGFSNLAVWTVRDFRGKVIREYESSATPYAASAWLWVEDYAHGLGRVLASQREDADGGRRQFHADQLGSTRLITTNDSVAGVTAGDGYSLTEHVYFPFGVEATSMNQETKLRNVDPGPGVAESRLKFTGHERDYYGGAIVENKGYLDYMHARYYNPNLGRFLSVDPVGGVAESPQSWNRYSYVRNRPTSLVDPSGAVAEIAHTQKDEADILDFLNRRLAGYKASFGGKEGTTLILTKLEGTQKFSKEQQRFTNLMRQVVDDEKTVRVGVFANSSFVRVASYKDSWIDVGDIQMYPFAGPGGSLGIFGHEMWEQFVGQTGGTKGGKLPYEQAHSAAIGVENGITGWKRASAETPCVGDATRCTSVNTYTLGGRTVKVYADIEGAAGINGVRREGY